VDADVIRIAPRSYAHRARRGPTIEDRLIARMLARWLDPELVDDRGASLSEAHAARAEQLAGARMRHSVARRLDRLLERADTPQEATALIVSIASRLRSAEPLQARGVARARTLLADPRHAHGRRDALAAALQDVMSLLDVRH
jgi:hypothetical protein